MDGPSGPPYTNNMLLTLSWTQLLCTWIGYHYYGDCLSWKNLSKANQTTLLVSHPPIFIFLCGRAVIIHYSLFNIMAF